MEDDDNLSFDELMSQRASSSRRRRRVRIPSVRLHTRDEDEYRRPYEEIQSEEYPFLCGQQSQEPAQSESEEADGQEGEHEELGGEGRDEPPGCRRRASTQQQVQHSRSRIGNSYLT